MSIKRDRQARRETKEKIREIAAALESLSPEGLSEDEIEKIEQAVECLDYVLES